MTKHYILHGHKVVPASLLTWAQWLETSNRQVAQTKRDGIRVSTVFLGLDHQFEDDGPPLLFETMIFGGKHNDYRERCSTWEQAEEMHKRACEIAWT